MCDVKNESLERNDEKQNNNLTYTCSMPYVGMSWCGALHITKLQGQQLTGLAGLCTVRKGG